MTKWKPFFASQTPVYSGTPPPPPSRINRDLWSKKRLASNFCHNKYRENPILGLTRKNITLTFFWWPGKRYIKAAKPFSFCWSGQQISKKFFVFWLDKYISSILVTFWAKICSRCRVIGQTSIKIGKRKNWSKL